jgi:hypothetical protein
MAAPETAAPTKTPPAEPIPAGQPATPPAAPEKPKDSIKDIDFEGYKFQVDTEMLDDVELLEMIDGIENGERPALIITLLKKLVGDAGYDSMKAYFVKKDGKFKMSKLAEIYKVIFENFDPKG